MICVQSGLDLRFRWVVLSILPAQCLKYNYPENRRLLYGARYGQFNSDCEIEQEKKRHKRFGSAAQIIKILAARYTVESR